MNELEQAQARIAELEAQVIGLQNGWTHTIQRLRGDVRGMLNGHMRRMLERALDSATSPDPWMPVIIEGLEESLKKIDDATAKLTD